MVANYADVIIMRHYLEGAARYASEVTDVPIINAGDGANQHPSQTMLDLYSIRKTQGTLKDLNVTMVGDLKYGRTVHSLIEGMSHFSPTFHFVAPQALALPREYVEYCEGKGIPHTFSNELSREVIERSDIIYMTRVQRERFTDDEDYETIKNSFILSADMLDVAKPNLKILHPLPRSMRSLMMWMTHHMHTISLRLSTVSMYVKLSFVELWASMSLRKRSKQYQ